MKRTVNVKNIKIGGGNRVSIQSMTNTDTSDFESTKLQISRLTDAGCDIVRLAVSNENDLKSCERLIKEVNVPLVADIQFDYRLAVKSCEIGFSKIRFNPGNIGGADKVKEIVAAAKNNNTAIRVGANSGSLSKEYLDRFGFSKDALVESALYNVGLLEKEGFYDIVVSVKSSDVKLNTEAYRLLDKKCEYPLHIGVTETGDYASGIIKSAVGIGSLLMDGIGDTVRVSLTGDPVREVDAARRIIRAAGRDKNYCEIISCPTCARCKYDLESLVERVADAVKDMTKPCKIAIMGCVVNGPGEAMHADLALCGGDGFAAVYKNGEFVKRVDMQDAPETILKMAEELNA